MLSLLIGPVILLALALAGAGVLVWKQEKLLQDGTLVAEDYPELTSIVQEKINSFYYGFALFFKRLGHYIYFYTLLVMRRLVIWSRIVSIMAEKRFSRLIDSVHGKGVVDKRGAVSLFLADISKK